MFEAKRSFLALAAASLITACGGGGGGGGTTPTVPGDAVTITAANAEAIAISAYATFDQVYYIVSGSEQQSPPPIKLAIDTVTDMVFDRERRTNSAVTATVVSYNCSGGGSFSIDYTETTSSESGTVSFSSCTVGSIVSISGSFSYNSAWNDSTSEYTDSANGSFSYTYNSNSYNIALNFAESGNWTTDYFSIRMSYSVSGIPGGGFLVTTTQNLTGISPSATSGQAIVTGANGTRARITVTGAGTFDVEYDDGSGTFTFIASVAT